MPLQPRSLIVLVIAGMLFAIIGVRAGGPIWFLHLGGGFAVAMALLGYVRWDIRNRP